MFWALLLNEFLLLINVSILLACFPFAFFVYFIALHFILPNTSFLTVLHVFLLCYSLSTHCSMFFLLCHSPRANSSIFFSYITPLFSVFLLCLFLSTHCFTFLFLTYHSFLLPAFTLFSLLHISFPPFLIFFSIAHSLSVFLSSFSGFPFSVSLHLSWR